MFGTTLMFWEKFLFHGMRTTVPRSGPEEKENLLGLAVGFLTLIAHAYGGYRWWSICSAELSFSIANPVVVANT